MKQLTQRVATALAVASGLALANSVQAQSWILSDFDNFNLSVTYANWNPDGSQIINGGTGFTPIITSGPTDYRVQAQGYGSGAYNLPSPLNASGAIRWELTFTINHTMQSGGGGGLWFGPNVTISDGTHQVPLTALNPGLAAFRSYGPYIGPGTYTLYGELGDLDTSTITAFNLEVDPAEFGTSAPYDITYQSFVLVPEPSTVALLVVGAAGLALARRRNKVS